MIVPSDKNIKVSSFESSENNQRQGVGLIVQFRIMNPHPMSGPLVCASSQW